jgi:cytochrome c5
MHDQPKYTPLERSTFFDDQRSSRPLVPGTVARGHLEADRAFFLGQSDEGPLQLLPMPVTHALLERGQERYDIYCSPCHDRTGGGIGTVVQRGFKKPPSLHAQRMRDVPVGYLFQVVSNGFGAMPSYAAQISAQDRWAIVGYIRALQLSQRASLDDVPPAERPKLDESFNE